jgi:hypothetical protein
VYLDLAMDDRVTVALHRAREPGAVYRSVTLGPAT